MAMPKLNQSNIFGPSHDDFPPNAEPPSPTAPPYSPITPTMSFSLPATSNESRVPGSNPNPDVPPSGPDFHNIAAFAQNAQHVPNQPAIPQSIEAQELPPSQPISISDNPDAIALRAAMSVLQIQRQQALRDMKTLEVQKEKALEDPEGFARGVSEGKIKARGMTGIVPAADERDDDADNGGDEMDTEVQGHKLDGEEGGKEASFGTIPSAQNVVRMPPVNWAKYHIVGESLDKLHEEQRARPSQSFPLRDEDLRPRERAPQSIIAAPYDPWNDRLGSRPTKSKGGAKKKS